MEYDFNKIKKLSLREKVILLGFATELAEHRDDVTSMIEEIDMKFRLDGIEVGDVFFILSRLLTQAIRIMNIHSGITTNEMFNLLKFMVKLNMRSEELKDQNVTLTSDSPFFKEVMDLLEEEGEQGLDKLFKGKGIVNVREVKESEKNE